jgi:hypothetical protein
MQPAIAPAHGPLRLRKALPERLRSLGLDELWLQNQIAADTSLLGLGELLTTLVRIVFRRHCSVVGSASPTERRSRAYPNENKSERAIPKSDPLAESDPLL